MNPFAEHYTACNTGTNAAKYAALADFPHIVDIEPAGVCNMRCLCCPTGLMAVTRPQSLMTLKTYRRILSECAEHGTAMRFIGFGEPTLNPDLVRFVWLADAAGLLTHLNTNGTKMSRQYTEDLFDAGLSSIKFSFQGVDRKSYKEMRRADLYEPLMAAIRLAFDVRGHRRLPYIHVSSSITYETPEQVSAFVESLEPYTDKVSVGRTIFDFIELDKVPAKWRADLAKAAALSTDDKAQPNPCPEVYDKLSIHSDGTVVSCCNDYNNTNVLGNVNDTMLAEMWRAPGMEKYRARLADGDYSLPLCATCFDYAGLTEGTA